MCLYGSGVTGARVSQRNKMQRGKAREMDEAGKGGNPVFIQTAA